MLAATEPASKKSFTQKGTGEGDRNWLEREELKDPRAPSSHHYNPASAGFFFGGGQADIGDAEPSTVIASGSR